MIGKEVHREMTTEQQFFLTILAAHLENAQDIAEPETPVDWPVLLQIADSHQMSGIVFSQCQSYIDAHPELASIRTQIDQKQASHMFYMVNKKRAYDKLENILTKAGIVFFPFKGAEIAQYYPCPSLRASGDTDLMMHTEDRNKAHTLLVEAGYQAHTPDNHEWNYTKGTALFELHDHLLFEETYNSPEAIRFCDRCWDYVNDNPETTRKTLDLSFHFIYLLLHLQKHMLYEGVGFRQFYDLAVLTKNAAAQLDWNWIEKELNGINLLQFGQTCMLFCERWFGVASPMRKPEMDEVFYEEATQKIFANGVFGFDDAENRENWNLNELQKYGKIRSLLHRVFPSYKSICLKKEYDYYTYVVGRPWLLPVVWVHRLFHSLSYDKGKNGRKLIHSAVSSDEKLSAREKTLKQWGLHRQ